jgi:HK97 family phage portal protein
MRIMGLQIGRPYHAVKHEEKTSLAWAITRILYAGQDVVWMPKDYANFARQGYQACVDAYACIELIARSVAGIPLLLYQVDKSGKRTEVTDHPIIGLLQRPNPEQGFSAFIRSVLTYKLISGNSFIEAVLDGPGKTPNELYSLRPDRMQVIVGDINNHILGYRYTVGSARKDYISKEVLHLKTFHPTNDFYGLSPIEVAANYIDMANAAATTNTKLLQNDMRPSGMFMFERQLTEDQKKEFNDSVKNVFMDSNRRGFPLVLDGKTEYKQLSMTPKDADFLELDRATTRRICRVFNVSAELINDPQNKTYANFKEARLAAYEENFLPEAFWLRDELNNWLIPKFEAPAREGEVARVKYMLDWDLDKVEALQDKKAEAYTRMAGAWWTTMNEKRVACGYGEEDDCDIFMMPMGLTEFIPGEESEPVVPPTVPPTDGPEDSPEDSPEDGPEDEPIDETSPDAGKSRRIEEKSYWMKPERKKAYWQTFGQRVKSREKSFEQIAKRYLSAMADDIKSKLANVSDLKSVNPKQLLNQDEAVRKYSKALTPWYKDNFIRAGNAGMQATKGDLFNDGEFKADDPTSWTFTMTASQESILKSMIFDSGTKVTKTNIKMIYDSLLSAQAADLTVNEFAQEIYQRINNFSLYKAQLWSRTESAKVDNYGQLEGYRETEFVDMKGWMCSFVEDSRADHMSADGDEVKLDENFNIGGQSMGFPGDPQAGPENVCNCLCTLYPAVGE